VYAYKGRAIFRAHLSLTFLGSNPQLPPPLHHSLIMASASIHVPNSPPPAAETRARNSREAAVRLCVPIVCLFCYGLRRNSIFICLRPIEQCVIHSTFICSCTSRCNSSSTLYLIVVAVYTVQNQHNNKLYPK
jgi:hypothetical protein